MREIRYLADLTPPMRKALIRCHATTILIDHDHGIHPATLTALQHHHLIHEARDKRMRPTWKPTSHGLQVIKTQPPRLLRAGVFAGYTTEPAHALHHEPEAVDPTTADVYAETGHERHQAFSRDQRPSLSQRLAAVENTIPRSELRVIERRVAAHERRTA